jgi:hypothetical protein
MKHPNVATFVDASFTRNILDKESQYLHQLSQISDHNVRSYFTISDARTLADEAQYWLNDTSLRDSCIAMLLAENSHRTVGGMYPSCARVQRRVP